MSQRNNSNRTRTRKPTIKQLAFCTAIREGLAPTAAYRRAGYAVTGDNRKDGIEAAHLMELPVVKAMLGNFRELDQQRILKKHDIDLDKLIEMTMEAFVMARDLSHPSTMVTAVSQISKMLGYDAPTKLADADGKPLRLLGHLTEAELISMLQRPRLQPPTIDVTPTAKAVN